MPVSTGTGMPVRFHIRQCSAANPKLKKTNNNGSVDPLKRRASLCSSVFFFAVVLCAGFVLLFPTISASFGTYNDIGRDQYNIVIYHDVNVVVPAEDLRTFGQMLREDVSQAVLRQ